MLKVKLLIPYLLSLVFIISGISKLISIESFELFIYSFKILSFTQASIVARVFIGLEFSIGFLYLIKLNVKAVSIFTLVLLSFFTVTILYLELNHSKEDCHCFGDLLQLSNTWSIIKNVFLAILVGLLLKNKQTEILKFRKTLFAGILVIGFGIAFAIHPPDFVFKKDTKEISYCESCLQSLLKKDNINNRKLVICFFSPQCKYCQLAAKKISTIAQKANNQSGIIYIFWDNKTKKKSKDFFSLTNSTPFQSLTIPTLQFLSITKGEMPLIILSNKGKTERTFRYDNMDEKAIVQFLKN